MEQDTILAADITAAQIAKYDAACKRLLAEKQILAHILKSCVIEFKDCSIDDIVNKYIEGDPVISDVAIAPNETNTAPLITGANTEDSSINEGKVTFDILFYALAPKDNGLIKLIINLEAQGKDNLPYDLVTRAVYYCSRLLSSQYGKEFRQSQYQDVKKVYSIWICMNPTRYPQNAITSYSITENAVLGEMRRKPECYDLLSIVMLNISNDIEHLESNVIKLLSVLLSNSLLPKNKINILENEFKLNMRETIESEDDYMCTLGQALVERSIAQGIETGYIRGKSDGLSLGRSEGRSEGRLASLTSLIKNEGFTPERALKALGITPEEWDYYLQKLS